MFLHLPKAAGSSIRHGVLRELPVQRSLTLDGTEGWPWHRSFMILRDPVDRFLSGWGERAPDYTLDKLLELLGDDSVHYNPPGFPNNGLVDIRHHLLPLTHEANAGMVREVSTNGSWVKFECLSVGVPAVTQWLGLIRPTLGVIRKGGSRKGVDELTPRELGKVEEFFRDDYEFLRRFEGGCGGALHQTLNS